MRRKKAIKITIFICAVVLLLLKEAPMSAYAVEESVGSAEEETETNREEGIPVKLQVPEKFDIVLDPWEMDGKGQIYSGEYTIKNLSDTTGMLQLTGIAIGIGENVAVCPNSDSIYDGNAKNVLVEMIVNGEERVALLPEGSEYQVVLKADENITITFTGRLNENVEDAWCDSDLKIAVVYDWVQEAGEDVAEGSTMLEEDGEEKNVQEEADMEKDGILEENDVGIENVPEENSAGTGNIPEENGIGTEGDGTATESISEENVTEAGSMPVEENSDAEEYETEDTDMGSNEEAEITEGTTTDMEEGEASDTAMPEGGDAEEMFETGALKDGGTEESGMEHEDGKKE